VDGAREQKDSIHCRLLQHPLIDWIASSAPVHSIGLIAPAAARQRWCGGSLSVPARACAATTVHAMCGCADVRALAVRTHPPNALRWCGDSCAGAVCRRAPFCVAFRLGHRTDERRLLPDPTRPKSTGSTARNFGPVTIHRSDKDHVFFTKKTI
jgi:hypothetical protein